MESASHDLVAGDPTPTSAGPTAERPAASPTPRATRALHDVLDVDALFHALPSAALLVSSDGAVVALNAAAEQLFGYRHGELLDQPVELLLPEARRAHHRDLRQAFLAAPTARVLGDGRALVAQRKDGTPLQVWIGLSPIARAAEVFVLVTIIDVSERKREERELRESKERLRVALDAANLGTWRYDVTAGRLSFDERSRRQHGIDRSDLPVSEALACIHSDDCDAVRRTMRDAADPAANQIRHAIEYRVVHPDGEVRWLSVQARAWFEGDGRARHATLVVGTSLDITQRKRAEESVLRSQKLEALGTLAGGIAHDFNNILLAITGNASLAAGDLPADHRAQESLAQIARASARATDLVRQILTFSRPQEQRREVIDLRSVVAEGLPLLRATLPAMVELQTDFAPDVGPVAADSTQIHQILVNLATNAAHALGARGGRIDVRVDQIRLAAAPAGGPADLRAGDYVRLTVSDNGCGISASTLDRIFDPFFTTKPVGQGSGLGLSVVHGIMKSHGGAVTVASQPGTGTAFQLYFPRAAAAAEHLAAPRHVSTPGAGEHLLYIDDDQALVSLATRLLRRLGYRVTGCDDPAHALRLFRERPQEFAAVITDLSMPGLSGFQVARALRDTRPDVPILMTSGYVRPEDRAEAERLGVLAVIAKPDTVEELGAALDRVFRLQRSHQRTAAG